MRPTTSVSQVDRSFTARSVPSMSRHALWETSPGVPSAVDRYPSPGQLSAARKIQRPTRSRAPGSQSRPPHSLELLRSEEERENSQNYGDLLSSSFLVPAVPRANSPLEAQAKLRPHRGGSRSECRARRPSWRRSRGHPGWCGQSSRRQPGTCPTPGLISSGERLRQPRGDSPRPWGSEDPCRFPVSWRGLRAMRVASYWLAFGCREPLLLHSALAPPPSPPNGELPGTTESRVHAAL